MLYSSSQAPSETSAQSSSDLNRLLVKCQLASLLTLPEKSSKHFKWCLATQSLSHSGLRRPWQAPPTWCQKEQPTRNEKRLQSERVKRFARAREQRRSRLCARGHRFLRRFTLCVYSATGFLLTGFIIALSSREILRASGSKSFNMPPYL